MTKHPSPQARAAVASETVSAFDLSAESLRTSETGAAGDIPEESKKSSKKGKKAPGGIDREKLLRIVEENPLNLKDKSQTVTLWLRKAGLDQLTPYAASIVMGMRDGSDKGLSTGEAFVSEVQRIQNKLSNPVRPSSGADPIEGRNYVDMSRVYYR